MAPAWAVGGLVPLAEAATFTAGCALLHANRVDAGRLETILALAVCALVLILLIALTPDVAVDADLLDPACLWPHPG